MRNIEFPSSILLVIRMNVQCGWIFKECTKNQTNRQTPTKQTYLDTKRGWCPRTGKGQRLMFKEAVSEYIWLATCQGKIYENKPPSATHETI